MAQSCTTEGYLEAMKEVLVLTERRYEGDGSLSNMPREYVDNVLQEDGLVVDALMRVGFAAKRVAWCNDGIRWDACAAALFRTTWDYFDRWEAFSAWLNHASNQTTLFNDPGILRWNLDKHYLQDLEQEGVAIVPTAYVPKHGHVPLFEVCDQRGWNDVVIKPAIAGGAFDTYRVTAQGDGQVLSPEPSNGSNSKELWHGLVAKHDMLVQPFLQDVVASGEVSLVWIDGQITHAVKKWAKQGDFRVQDDHGGTVKRIDVSDELVQLGTDIMERCTRLCHDRGWASPLYARVDLMRDDNEAWQLSELELVEPELWFRFCPPAADALAQAIQRRLQA